MSDNRSSIAVVRPAGLDLEERIDRERDLIRKSYAPGVTEDEFGMFLASAKHLGLDPVLREIWAIPGYKLKDGGQSAAIIMPSINGLRKLADLTGLVAATEGPFFCGPDGKWQEMWLNTEPPAAAKFVIWRKDRTLPIQAIATFKNRAKRNQYGLMGKWKETPDEMLGINAERMAWKLSGLVNNNPRPVAYDDEGNALNPRAVAMARLHAVGAEKGLSHEQMRTVAEQFAPESDSMVDMEAEDLHQAADLIEAVGASALPDEEAAKAREAFVQRIFAAEKASNKKAYWESLQADANGISGGWELMIEWAPSEPYARRLVEVAKQKHGLSQQAAGAAFQAWQDRHQTRAEAAAPNVPAPAQGNLMPEPAAAEPAPEPKILSWGMFWRLVGQRGYDLASFEAIVGRPVASFGNDCDAAMSALNAAEAATEGVVASDPDEATEATFSEVGDEPGDFDGIEL